MPLLAVVIIALVMGAVAVFLAAFLVIPKDRAGTSAFVYRLHGFLCCKTELLPPLFQYTYVFLTVGGFFYGFFSLFSWDRVMGATLWHGSVRGPVGLLAVPVLARLLLEVAAQLYRLTDNSAVIRRHLTGEKEEKEKLPPSFVFCTVCGTRYDQNNEECPVCKGKKQ